jgi:hypothetical protein
MLGGGVALTTTGLATANKNVNDDPFHAIEKTGPIIVGGGRCWLR